MLEVSSPIRADRLVLRPFVFADVDDLFAIQSHPDVVRYLYWDVRSPPEVAAVVRRRTSQTGLNADGDVLVLAVERCQDRRVIGDVSLWWRSVQHRQGEIGFVFHPDAQGQGYAGEAADALLDLAFGRLGLHRVYGRTDARNAASAALMRRLGMRQEAHLRHNEMFKGQWADELVFALLDDEWRERKAESRC